MTGVEMIELERERQISAEGWTAEHDAEHAECELLKAALCYGTSALGDFDQYRDEFVREAWPFEWSAWKPEDTPVRDLVKAGALIAAEIDRRNRA